MQKELRQERIAVGGFLATDDFLRECTAPRIFAELVTAGLLEKEGAGRSNRYRLIEPKRAGNELFGCDLGRFESQTEKKSIDGGVSMMRYEAIVRRY